MDNYCQNQNSNQNSNQNRINVNPLPNDFQKKEKLVKTLYYKCIDHLFDTAFVQNYYLDIKKKN